MNRETCVWMTIAVAAVTAVAIVALGVQNMPPTPAATSRAMAYELPGEIPQRPDDRDGYVLVLEVRDMGTWTVDPGRGVDKKVGVLWLPHRQQYRVETDRGMIMLSAAAEFALYWRKAPDL